MGLSHDDVREVRRLDVGHFVVRGLLDVPAMFWILVCKTARRFPNGILKLSSWVSRTYIKQKLSSTPTHLLCHFESYP